MTNICSVDACANVAITRGWCKTHYTRWIKTGSTERKWSCQTCDAELDHSSKRYCGPACKPKWVNPKTCSVDGCDSRVNARGWCTVHYNRWSATGSIERSCVGCGGEVKDGRTRWCSKKCKPACAFDGCPHRAYASNGFCSGHDRQLREEGTVREFKFVRPDAGGSCKICEAEIPNNSRAMYCSGACRQVASKSRGSRTTSIACQGCGSSVSITERRADGRLRRSDLKWCNTCADAATRRRMYRYGVTPERFTAALAAGCEICGRRDINLHVDHDHDCCPGEFTCGNCVRGFLCGSCNRAVGLLNNDPNQMLAAATYVMKSTSVIGCAAARLDHI